MAIISTACQPVDVEGLAGFGQDEYDVVNTYPGMPGADASSWWKDLISGGVKTFENILTAKTETKGVLTQTSPGVFRYVQPEGSGVTLPVGTGTFGLAPASSGMGMFLVAGIGVLVLFMMMKRK